MSVLGFWAPELFKSGLVQDFVSLRFHLLAVSNLLLFLWLSSMNAPVMVELEGETDPLEVIDPLVLFAI